MLLAVLFVLALKQTVAAASVPDYHVCSLSELHLPVGEQLYPVQDAFQTVERTAKALSLTLESLDRLRPVNVSGLDYTMTRCPDSANELCASACTCQIPTHLSSYWNAPGRVLTLSLINITNDKVLLTQQQLAVRNAWVEAHSHSSVPDQTRLRFASNLNYAYNAMQTVNPNITMVYLQTAAVDANFMASACCLSTSVLACDNPALAVR